ncbi:MAG: hypothetical protein K9M75_01650 [Phycisphaerae bacterium]|nr:hypothetical protein [Phycisphaerae bacterium]
MKKNLIPITAFIIIAVFAASVFSEAPKPQRAQGRPERPSVKTPPPAPGAGMQRTKGAPQASRGIEVIKEQQTKKVEAEIKRINAAHEADIAQLQAILKQANDEKAAKTAAMLTELIEKKNTDNKANVKKFQDRMEAFNKRMQRGQTGKGLPDPKAIRTKPERTRTPIDISNLKKPEKK